MPKDRLLFAKEGRARYISHLDLMRTFQRAFLRADIPIKHTEGFNPHPFISIALPLSLGYSSRCEILEFGLLPGTDHEEVAARLNPALPEGVTVLDCYAGERSIKELAFLRYAVTFHGLQDPEGAKETLSKCLSRSSWVISKHSKKAKSGFTEIDVIPLIKGYHFTETDNGALYLDITVGAQNPGLNPNVIVNAFTAEYPQYTAQLVQYGRQEVLDDQGKTFR